MEHGIEDVERVCQAVSPNDEPCDASRIAGLRATTVPRLEEILSAPKVGDENPPTTGKSYKLGLRIEQICRYRHSRGREKRIDQAAQNASVGAVAYRMRELLGVEVSIQQHVPTEIQSFYHGLPWESRVALKRSRISKPRALVWADWPRPIRANISFLI